MIAVLQRVAAASVSADNYDSGKCGGGLVILLGVSPEDERLDADLLSEKIAKCRIFTDENDKLSLSVNDIGGSVLVVPNFTLLADYSHGNRPDFTGSAPYEKAKELFEYFVGRMSALVPGGAEKGMFGEDMTLTMCCRGPVTIVMDSNVLKSRKHK
jgi:D-tyrosyl-tRNA(Tyr) deacylase